MTQLAEQLKPFEYLGKIFTPILRITGRNNWQRKAAKVWGEKLEIDGYKHEDFYKVAKKAGCGKFDVFLLDGEQVIPCNELRYYGEPTWFAGSKEKEEKQRLYERNQRWHLKDALQSIEKTLFTKLETAFVSGAIPDRWKENENQCLVNAVIDSFCQDRPHRMLDNDNRKDSDNLHKFI